jgi:5-formyltetrahydrofolate cyclo-ligase
MGDREPQPDDALAERKAALRRRMRQLRLSIPPPVRAELGERVAEHLFSLPEMADARTVMVFYSFGAELPTSTLIERLHRDGRRVLLPFLEPGATMEAAEISPDDVLSPTTYGPKEPSRRSPVDPGQVDVVVAPGLAFDREGHRLGYGGGHYDRYMSRLRRGVPRIGVGFTAQLVDEVPAGEGDVLLDAVVTEDGIVRTPA